MNTFAIIMFVILQGDTTPTIYKSQYTYETEEECKDNVERKRDEFGAAIAEVFGPLKITAFCLDQETILEIEERAKPVDGIEI